MDQPSLFSGPELRDDALEQVEINADPSWMIAVEKIIRSIPPGQMFTTDRIWNELSKKFPGVTTNEPRAMGAAMRNAVRNGLIEGTGEYHQTVRPEAHARPIPIWRRK